MESIMGKGLELLVYNQGVIALSDKMYVLSCALKEDR